MKLSKHRDILEMKGDDCMFGYISVFWVTLIALYIIFVIGGGFDILSYLTGLYTTGVFVITAITLKSIKKRNAER